MFTIKWYIGGHVHEAVTATPEAAWEIYRVLKESVKKDKTFEDYWIRISTGCIPVNPEKGSELPLCERGVDTTFILKKGEA